MVKSTEPPCIAVSACLLGQPVRYDGGSKRHHGVLALLREHGLAAIPVCPEVNAGLAVPRPPVELVHQDDGIAALGVADRRLDVTDALRRSAAAWLAAHPGLCGMVCKARSPSCGLTVAVHTRAGETTGRVHPGLFVACLGRLRPDLPIVEENALETAAAREAFAARVRAYAAHRASASGRSRPPGHTPGRPRR